MCKIARKINSKKFEILQQKKLNFGDKNFFLRTTTLDISTRSLERISETKNRKEYTFTSSCSCNFDEKNLNVEQMIFRENIRYWLENRK